MASESGYPTLRVFRPPQALSINPIPECEGYTILYMEDLEAAEHLYKDVLGLGLAYQSDLFLGFRLNGFRDR